mmetsp:Transcript_13964/g.48659  ORF Transcript_13964/g.48659 Transcript_13964/m.48659 type:complete len:201 (-) Transcript_13964:1850-2452(-)
MRSCSVSSASSVATTMMDCGTFQSLGENTTRSGMVCSWSAALTVIATVTAWLGFVRSSSVYKPDCAGRPSCTLIASSPVRIAGTSLSKYVMATVLSATALYCGSLAAVIAKFAVKSYSSRNPRAKTSSAVVSTIDLGVAQFAGVNVTDGGTADSAASVGANEVTETTTSSMGLVAKVMVISASCESGSQSYGTYEAAPHS